MPLFTQKKFSLPKSLTSEEYSWAPFSILDTTNLAWLRRREEWLSIIPDSTAGRDVKRFNATPTNVFSSHEDSTKAPSSVSMFDPCLAELLIRWFSRKGDKILDPFAGGCVRGIVSAILGRNYHGLDLNQEQVMVNLYQAKSLCDKYTDVGGGKIIWQTGDSDSLLQSAIESGGMEFDMVFTCPPYYTLERYSNDPRDLSNMPSYENFLDKYSSILYKASRLLKEDSFFAIVVSEVRADSKDIANSQYVGFVPDTVHILRDVCGLKYYNEIILENSIGSLPLRAPRIFNRTRKIGRRHQNVLIFYKGDIGKIENKFTCEKV